MPGLDKFGFGVAIVAAVDLYGRESLSIEAQPLVLRQSLGIKKSLAPIRVDPAAGPGE